MVLLGWGVLGWGVDLVVGDLISIVELLIEALRNKEFACVLPMMMKKER